MRFSSRSHPDARKTCSFLIGCQVLARVTNQGRDRRRPVNFTPRVEDVPHDGPGPMTTRRIDSTQRPWTPALPGRMETAGGFRPGAAGGRVPTRPARTVGGLPTHGARWRAPPPR